MSMSQLLISFRGRLNRKPYWMAAIGVTVVVAVVLLIFWALSGEHELAAFIAVWALFAILYIPLVWVGLAISAKRLHDRDKSAWWLLLFYAVPLVLSAASSRIGDSGFILDLAGLAIIIWAFVELGCLRGTIEPNRYGPDPLPPPALPAAT
jgi:uncharacterized membrane protein YhaH (DUF805 family)